MNRAIFPAQSTRKFILLALVSLFVTGCGLVEQKILYNAEQFPRNWNPPVQSELDGLILEDAWFDSLDGTRLHGWYVQPANSKYEHIVLFAHGRSGNVSSFKSRLFEFVRQHQVAVMVFDYRGFGKSEGHPTEWGLYRDVTAAQKWLAQREGIAPSDVILMGNSLGAAVAIDLASREGAKALIVESGFTSFPEVLRYHTRNLLKGRRFLARYDSGGKIGQYSGPVFISHGAKDKAIPFSHGLRLAQSANSASYVQFVKVDGGHTTPPSESYKTTLGEFLQNL